MGYGEWRKEKDFWQRSDGFAERMRQLEREEHSRKKRETEREADKPTTPES